MGLNACATNLNPRYGLLLAVLGQLFYFNFVFVPSASDRCVICVCTCLHLLIRFSLLREDCSLRL